MDPVLSCSMCTYGVRYTHILGTLAITDTVDFAVIAVLKGRATKALSFWLGLEVNSTSLFLPRP